ncbi:MAG: type III PLP-dependent enzyme [Proteobacteria bacterium]|nr:type III PLP-dependent enzyme [Pseudomonadota bacterium]
MKINRVSFANVEEMLRALQPVIPVYCIYPDVYEANARDFVAGFPGRVLYAVKANAYPDIIQLIYQGGVRHFDCASLAEIETVMQVCPDALCYFMTPVRLRGAAREAQSRFGVKHFMIDHLSGLEPLAGEIDMGSSVVFARMATSHPSAMQDLSVRFGAPPADVADILNAIAGAGAEPALAFNVGSSVTSPDAYRHAIGLARNVLAALPFEIRLIDIGGGFPRSYPGFEVPSLNEYFDVIRANVATLPPASNREVLVEPGRALAAPGLSAVVEVLLRKEQRLYLNDGMYGIFWELRFKGHERFPVRAFRDGKTLRGETQSFRLHGPTCDSTDTMPGEVELPVDIRPGDYLEFSGIGAYSLSGRTEFNGHYSDQLVTITG